MKFCLAFISAICTNVQRIVLKFHWLMWDYFKSVQNNEIFLLLFLFSSILLLNHSALGPSTNNTLNMCSKYDGFSASLI